MAVTWILVAHGSAGKILRVTKNGEEISVVKNFSHEQTAQKGTDIYTDRPGRSFESSSPVRHAMAYSESTEDHERRVFAKEIGDFLETSLAQNSYHKLILVAPPSLLGALRKTMCDPVNKVAAHQLDKNLYSLDLKDKELVEKIRQDLNLAIL